MRNPTALTLHVTYPFLAFLILAAWAVVASLLAHREGRDKKYPDLTEKQLCAMVAGSMVALYVVLGFLLGFFL